MKEGALLLTRISMLGTRNLSRMEYFKLKCCLMAPRALNVDVTFMSNSSFFVLNRWLFSRPMQKWRQMQVSAGEK